MSSRYSISSLKKLPASFPGFIVTSAMLKQLFVSQYDHNVWFVGLRCEGFVVANEFKLAHVIDEIHETKILFELGKEGCFVFVNAKCKFHNNSHLRVIAYY